MLLNDSKIICPDCQAVIKASEKMEIGDIIECEECGCEVEILSLEPLQYRELVEQK